LHIGFSKRNIKYGTGINSVPNLDQEERRISDA